MDSAPLAEIKKLSDRELLERVQVLADRERETTTTLIAHLAVLDERRLYLGEGCSSLFIYCTRRLRFSESSAYRRVEAARLVRRFPVVLEMLSAGWINLTTIRLLAPELTPANHRDLLEAATHKSRVEVERLIAGLRPQPPVASMVRRLPCPTAGLALSASTGAQPSDTAGRVSAGVLTSSPPLVVRPTARPVITPLSPKTYKVQFTASEEAYSLLRQAQDLLRHQIPSGDVGEVMTKALQLLVRHLEREKTAATDHPRARQAVAPRSRHIPADVRRAVWRRDAGRCAFVGHDGWQCTERALLEFHHIIPYAAGGAATEDNIELRCRAHNGFEAERWPERRAEREAGHAPAPSGAAY
jgi:5-methylcytosine-specific restriction endonuclease McrA